MEVRLERIYTAGELERARERGRREMVAEIIGHFEAVFKADFEEMQIMVDSGESRGHARYRGLEFRKQMAAFAADEVRYFLDNGRWPRSPELDEQEGD